jgi:hypothetical protein
VIIFPLHLITPVLTGYDGWALNQSGHDGEEKKFAAARNKDLIPQLLSPQPR